MKSTVALVDSGVHAEHPHIVDRGGDVRAWRVASRAEGTLEVVEDPEGTDVLGHGTAAAAAILDLAPGSMVESIRVFEAESTAEFERVLIALDKVLELRPLVCNLSLGTTSTEYAEQLTSRVVKFAENDIAIVAPAFWQGLPCYPGCLEGAHGVRIDASLAREQPEQRSAGGRSDWFASPYPRELPGLPRDSNLAGVSMACANVSGYLLRRWSSRSSPE